MRNGISDNAFDMALMMNKRDAMLDMVEKGYKIDKVRDEYGTTILNRLIIQRNEIRQEDPKSMDATIIKNKIWDLIYAGANAEAFDNNSTNALLLSVLYNDSEILDVLLWKNPDLSMLYDGASLFDIAVYKKYNKVIKKLLEYANEKVLEEDEDFSEILNPQTVISTEKIRKFIEKQLSSLS